MKQTGRCPACTRIRRRSSRRCARTCRTTRVPTGSGDDSARDREAAAAWTAFTGRLNWWQRLVTLPRVRRAVATIKRYYVWRERVRSDMIRVLAVLRRSHLVLADRFVERGWLDDRGDYFHVLLPEIGAVIAGSAPPETLRRIAATRRAEQHRYRSMRMPLFMKEGDLPRLLRAAAVSGLADLDGNTLTGLPVSGGLVEGEVVVVRDPADFGRMTRGAILVAPATDPSWTPLFTLASGVIVEVGGVLSHASTIAREFGLPAIANVKHATRRLRTGERVRLDAHSGRIERITHDSSSVLSQLSRPRGQTPEPSARCSQPSYKRTQRSGEPVPRRLREVMAGMAIHQHAPGAARQPAEQRVDGPLRGARATAEPIEQREKSARSRSHWAVSTRVSSSGAVLDALRPGATKLISCLTPDSATAASSAGPADRPAHPHRVIEVGDIWGHVKRPSGRSYPAADGRRDRSAPAGSRSETVAID